jgi:uncharacterized Zn finger protein
VSAPTVEEKASALLAAGMLRVVRVPTKAGGVVATCRSSSDGQKVYTLGFDPRKREWRCTCTAGRRGRCSHLTALRLVVDEPQGGEAE